MGRGKNTKSQGALVLTPPFGTRKQETLFPDSSNISPETNLNISEFAKTSDPKEIKRLIAEDSYLAAEDLKAIFGNAPNVKEYIKSIEDLGLLSPEDFSELKDIISEGGKIKGANLTFQTAAYIWNYLDVGDFHATQMEKVFGVEKRLRTQYEEASEALKELDVPGTKSSEITEWGARGRIDGSLDKIKRNRDLTPDERAEEAADLARRYVIMGARAEARHDKAEYIVYKIIKKSRNFIPTMTNTRGVDFFVNGRGWDLKTTDSPTGEFKEKHPDWRQAAIDNPEEVAKYLYQGQHAERFTDTPRLFVIDSGKYTDETERDEALEKAIENVKPIPVNFEYKHKGEKEKRKYRTKAMVVVL